MAKVELDIEKLQVIERGHGSTLVFARVRNSTVEFKIELVTPWIVSQSHVLDLFPGVPVEWIRRGQ